MSFDRNLVKVTSTHVKLAKLPNGEPEIFATVQGEGPNTGVPTVFIRLSLCNLACVWCDSLAAGTPVLTERLGWIPIESIQEGDEIVGVSKNTEDHEPQDRWVYTKATATNLVSHKGDSALRITAEDGNEIVCTKNHEILVRRKSANGAENSIWGWLRADEIKKGDILWSVGQFGEGTGVQEMIEHQARNEVAVSMIEEVNGQITFYDIGSSCGNFIANGLVVHNTPYTWNWEGTDFRHKDMQTGENKKYCPSKEIIELTPIEIMGYVSKIGGENIKHIVITGGEPLMHRDSASFKVLISALKSAGYHIEIETNGTLIPREDFIDSIDQFNISPKLENSGNALNARRKNRAFKFFATQPNAYFKFVVTGEADLEEIFELQKIFNIPASKILLMPEGRTDKETQQRAHELVELCKQHGFRFCNRLHVWIWDGAVRGV